MIVSLCPGTYTPHRWASPAPPPASSSDCRSPSSATPEFPRTGAPYRPSLQADNNNKHKNKTLRTGRERRRERTKDGKHGERQGRSDEPVHERERGMLLRVPHCARAVSPLLPPSSTINWHLRQLSRQFLILSLCCCQRFDIYNNFWSQLVSF